MTSDRSGSGGEYAFSDCNYTERKEIETNHQSKCTHDPLRYCRSSSSRCGDGEPSDDVCEIADAPASFKSCNAWKRFGHFANKVLSLSVLMSNFLFLVTQKQKI